jgi:hypothetical protein
VRALTHGRQFRQLSGIEQPRHRATMRMATDDNVSHLLHFHCILNHAGFTAFASALNVYCSSVTRRTASRLKSSGYRRRVLEEDRVSPTSDKCIANSFHGHYILSPSGIRQSWAIAPGRGPSISDNLSSSSISELAIGGGPSRGIPGLVSKKNSRISRGQLTRKPGNSVKHGLPGGRLSDSYMSGRCW